METNGGDNMVLKITSQTNGHKIIYVNKEWIYEDIKEPISKARPCKYCGKYPTKEGHDGCIGHLDGVKYACCGHGINKSYAILENGNKLEFNGIEEMKECFKG